MKCPKSAFLLPGTKMVFIACLFRPEEERHSANPRYAFEKKKQQDKRHIYYIAPFLSILEQNAGEIRDLLKDDEHVLEHHSNVVIEETDKESLKRYELYTDEWSSPVILTTMVQFLNVLLDLK